MENAATDILSTEEELKKIEDEALKKELAKRENIYNKARREEKKRRRLDKKKSRPKGKR